MFWLTLWGCSSTVVYISPDTPNTNDTIEVIAERANGDREVVSSVGWYREGVLTVDARSLSPNWTTRGQRWNAEVSLENGTVLTSEVVQIENALPVVDIAIIPEVPTAGYPVTCRVDVQDADDDAAWRIVLVG